MRYGPIISLLVAVAAAGCQVVPEVKTPAPPLELIESAALNLPADCQAEGSYFVGFIVNENGRTSAIKAPDGPACVSAALTAWVSSFRYAPRPQSLEASIEWMLVSGRKGS